MLSKRHETDITTNAFDRLPFIYYDEKPENEHEYIKIIGRQNRERSYKFIRRDYVSNYENLEKYKIFVPKANGSGALGEVLSTPLIGEPLIGATQTFISIGTLSTLEEAEAIQKYIKTKFARVMLGILKLTQDNPASKWEYVPMQDFTEQSDIDWTQSIENIDQQLYKKYNLNQEEIDFIEEKVQAMD